VVVFDPLRERVVALQRTWYRDLLLREDRVGSAEPPEATQVLAAAVAARAAELFEADREASAWLARVAFLRHWLPEVAWPSFEGETLTAILEAACAGKQSLDELRLERLTPHLEAHLSPQQRHLLATEAPESITVPSQSRIRLAYQAQGPPILAARLQELFGWTESPKLAKGRVRVLLHLLSPSFRPVQITDDLQSFWSNTYFQVRKDLRARYPKHAWPLDPLTAQPQSRPGKRKG
jgi:ATP-dependent helicase HrpB